LRRSSAGSCRRSSCSRSPGWPGAPDPCAARRPIGAYVSTGRLARGLTVLTPMQAHGRGATT
jgi:hypothetical protein